jgi:glycerophosphoryl diester phosphodiesterase
VSNLENKYSLIANIKHKRYGGVLPTVTANDNVLFEIELYDDVTKYDLSEVTSVTLVTMKKNKTSVIRNGTMVNGLLRFKIGGSETTESGRVEGTIQLYDVDNNRISSAPIAFEVVRDPSLQGVLPTDDKTLVIANESLFLETIEKGNNLQEQLDTLVVSGDSSPAADQARVDAKGVTKSSLKTRLDDDYNELSSSVAQKAEQSFVENQLAYFPNLANTIRAAKGVKFIAHRGMSLIAPENTLPAYEKAGEVGMWGAECDIQQTSDGVWVLMHDDTVDRMTNGTGSVSSLTLSAIKALTVDAGNNIAMYPNLKVPTLEEFLQTCKKYNLVPVIEIKSGQTFDTLVNLIRTYGYEESCIIISMTFGSLQAVRAFSKKVILQWVGDFSDTNIGYVKGLGNAGLDNEYTTVTKANVEKAHSNGLLVGCWTVNNYQTAKTLIGYGVDFITTDIIAGVI